MNEDAKELKEIILRPSWKAAIPRIIITATVISVVWTAIAVKPYMLVKAANELGISTTLRAVYPFIPYILIAIFAVACIYLLRDVFTAKYTACSAGITCQKYGHNTTIRGEEISEARIVLQTKLQKMLSIGDILVISETGERRAKLLQISNPQKAVNQLNLLINQSKKRGEQELRAALASEEEPEVEGEDAGGL